MAVTVTLQRESAPRAASWLVLDRSLQLVVGALLGVLVARHLGPADFGIVSIGVAVLGLAAPAATGNQQLLVADLSRGAGAERSVIRAGVSLAAKSAALAIGVCLAVAVFVPFGSPDASTAVLIASIGLFAAPAAPFEAALQARRQARLVARTRIAVVLVWGLLRLSAIALDVGPRGFVALAALQPVAVGGGLVAAHRRFRGAARTEPRDRTYERHLTRRSVPLLATAASIGVYTLIDQFFIASLSGSKELGFYGAAVVLAQGAQTLALAAEGVVTSRLAAGREDAEWYARQTALVMSAMTVVALALAAILFISAPRLVSALYGDEFARSAGLLRVLVLSFPFVFLGVAQSSITVIEGHERSFLWRTLGGAGINVVLNVLLIPDHGAMGAAWATVATYAFAGVFGNLLAPRTRPVFRAQFSAMRPLSLARGARMLASTARDAARRSGHAEAGEG